VVTVEAMVGFEVPDVPETYVHRIGRTARAGSEGVRVSLCEPSRLANVRRIEQLVGTRLLHLNAREAAEEKSQRPADTRIDECRDGCRGGRRLDLVEEVRGRGAEGR
jgi:superfamily II DNA/RNA helicase